MFHIFVLKWQIEIGHLFNLTFLKGDTPNYGFCILSVDCCVYLSNYFNIIYARNPFIYPIITRSASRSNKCLHLLSLNSYWIAKIIFRLCFNILLLSDLEDFNYITREIVSIHYIVTQFRLANLILKIYLN